MKEIDSARVSLELITRDAGQLKSVLKSNIRSGDCLIVCTCNSRYVLSAQEDGSYIVSGGWFARTGTCRRVRINGCTWGGCIIKVDIAAAVGLCIEFSNSVTTSPVCKIGFFNNGQLN